MNLNVEVVPSDKAGKWVWRVRSDDTLVGSTVLAVGMSKSEAAAWEVGRAVHVALSPIFTHEWRAVPEVTTPPHTNQCVAT